MTWLLLQGATILARGSFADVLDAAEARALCQRAFHPDGTELAPRIDRTCSILPETMARGFARPAARFTVCEVEGL